MIKIKYSDLTKGIIEEVIKDIRSNKKLLKKEKHTPFQFFKINLIKKYLGFLYKIL